MRRFRFMHVQHTAFSLHAHIYNMQRFRFMHRHLHAALSLMHAETHRLCAHTAFANTCMHRSIHFSRSTHMLNNPVTESFKAVHGGSSEGSTGFNRNCNRRLDLPRTLLLNTVCMYCIYIYIYIYARTCVCNATLHYSNFI